MDYEIKDCIDAGTEFCPCHLAETGDCILCSQLSGKHFCNCINWKGTCIYQEFYWNGNHAKKTRETYICKILKKEYFDKNLLCLTIPISHTIVKQLSKPGSFVFIKRPEDNDYFNFPISIMDTDEYDNFIKIVIDVKGIKTKTIEKLSENENIAVKAPYWNGILGLKNIDKCKNSSTLLLVRGIGMAPCIPVIKKLHENGNKIILALDKSIYKDAFIQKYIDLYNVQIETFKIGSNEILSEDLKSIIYKYEKNVGLIFCSMSDIFISKILNIADKNVPFACSNNAKMCCGEGICGACSSNYKGHVVKKMCKVQSDPRYIFQGKSFL